MPLDDYKIFLDRLRDERDDLYDQAASFSISSDDGAIEEHVLRIIKALGK